MILILVKIKEAIEKSRLAADFSVSEDLGRLQITGTMSLDALSAWQGVFDISQTWLTIQCIDSIDDIISPNQGQENERYRFNLIFELPIKTAYIFTPEGWRSFLLNDELVITTVNVKLLFIENGFKTRLFFIEQWVDYPCASDVPVPGRPYIRTRSHVKSNSPQFMAPTFIEPWVLLEPISLDSIASNIWKDISAKMILRSIPNELYIDSSHKVYLLGSPPRRLELEEEAIEEIMFDKLQEAASWIYLEGDDTEVRHTFLSTELAREWNPSLSFCRGINSRLPNAMESAKLVYKAHLRASSKDTLKTLGDLRKTLADDIQKLLQQARDLSTTVWRDVAIVLGAVAVRYAMDSIKANQISTGFAIIYGLVLIYIVTSYLITISINKKFIEIMKNSQEIWRNKLYGFLDDDDYQKLAAYPLAKAYRAYNTSRRITSIVVFFVGFSLIIAIFVEMKWFSFDMISNILSMVKD